MPDGSVEGDFHRIVELSDRDGVEVTMHGDSVVLNVRSGMEWVSVTLDNSQCVAVVDALTDAHDSRLPEVMDEPMDGVNVCTDGCFLGLVARRYQEWDECPECGAPVEVQDVGR